MRIKAVAGLAIGLAALLIPAAVLQAQWTLDAETGLVWSGYNDVRIPGAGGILSRSRGTSRPTLASFFPGPG